MGACDDQPIASTPTLDATVAVDSTSLSDATPDDGTVIVDVLETDAILDEGVVDAGSICPDTGPCPTGMRRVGCGCFGEMDRRCLSDEHCRADEECEHVRGTLSVCRFEPPPLRSCPGAACPRTEDRRLLAAFVGRDVTPQGFEPPTPAGLDGVQMAFDPPFPEGTFLDCGLDGLCLDDEGYPGPDEGEGDGVMQGLWLAGFSNGRAAQYCPAERIGCDEPECCISKFAHDPIKVQTAVIRQGGITVAFVSVDTVGLFHSDIDRIQGRVAALGVDLLLMAATHNHEGPDTAGQWGPGVVLPVLSGRSPSFIAAIEDQTVDAIAQGLEALRPAVLRAGVLDVGVTGLAVTDSRTPYIFNDDLPIMHFVDEASGDALGTLLSFGSHAEAAWSENPYISSDYPHYLRHYIQNGLDAVEGSDGVLRRALPGTGAEVVFFAGSVGGLIHPGGGGALDYGDRAPPNRHGFAVADALGQRLASYVLGALTDGVLPEANVDEVPLQFATKRFLMEAENEIFRLAALILGVIERDVYNATSVGGAFTPGLPQIQTQVAAVRLGPVTIFTAPGEVFGETLCGGFPGRHHVRTPVIGDTEERRTPALCDASGLPADNGQSPCIIRPGAEYPPDWSRAPEGPYVYELIPGDVPFFIGLGMDFLGYLVPPYDFAAPVLTSAAPGDHYEETNSIGPQIVPRWQANLEAVLGAL